MRYNKDRNPRNTGRLHCLDIASKYLKVLKQIIHCQAKNGIDPFVKKTQNNNAQNLPKYPKILMHGT